MLMFLAFCQYRGYKMQTSSLNAIHSGLRSLSERLGLIEDLVEEVILSQLPKAKINAREMAKIMRSVAEMRAGERVTLEELAGA